MADMPSKELLLLALARKMAPTLASAESRAKMFLELFRITGEPTDLSCARNAASAMRICTSKVQMLLEIAEESRQRSDFDRADEFATRLDKTDNSSRQY